MKVRDWKNGTEEQKAIGNAANREGRHAGLHWSGQCLEQLLKKRKGNSISRKILDRLLIEIRGEEAKTKAARDTLENVEI